MIFHCVDIPASTFPIISDKHLDYDFLSILNTTTSICLQVLLWMSVSSPRGNPARNGIAVSQLTLCLVFWKSCLIFQQGHTGLLQFLHIITITCLYILFKLYNYKHLSVCEGSLVF